MVMGRILLRISLSIVGRIIFGLFSSHRILHTLLNLSTSARFRSLKENSRELYEKRYSMAYATLTRPISLISLQSSLRVPRRNAFIKALLRRQVLFLLTLKLFSKK